MNGGICDNCGFPLRKFRKIVPPIKKERERRIRWNMKLM